MGLQEERERPYRSMEQRLAAYRQECEARLQDEVRRQVSEFVHPQDALAKWRACSSILSCSSRLWRAASLHALCGSHHVVTYQP